MKIEIKELDKITELAQGLKDELHNVHIELIKLNESLKGTEVNNMAEQEVKPAGVSVDEEKKDEEGKEEDKKDD